MSSDSTADPASSSLIGTGVRIGLYLQGWSFLVNCFFNSLEEIPGHILPTAVIVFTFLISTVILISSGEIEHNEVLVTVGLMDSAIFPALSLLNIAETRNNGLAVLFTIVDVLMAEGIFLWLTGHGGSVDRVSFIWGWIFFVWTLALFPKPILCWWRLAVRYVKGKKELETPDTSLWRIFIQKARKERPDKSTTLLTTRWFLPAASVIYMTVQIIIVENNIRRKGLKPNNSVTEPEQLIPLVTGVLSWVDASLRVLRKLIRRQKGYPEDEGEDKLPTITVTPRTIVKRLLGRDKEGQEKVPEQEQSPTVRIDQDATHERWVGQSPSAYRV